MRLNQRFSQLLAAPSRFVPILVANRSTGKNPFHVVNLSDLKEIVEQLTTLNGSTEQDFLAIGARLMEFLSIADRIAKGVGSVVESTAGEHGARASAVLGQALERCRLLVDTTTQGRAHLAGLRGEAVKVGSIFGGFRQAVASFHVVCTMTRIEAARLGGAGDELGSLTDEVLALAHRMEALVQRVLDAALAVDRQVDHIAAGLRGTNELLDRLALTVPHVLRNLDAFSAQQEVAAEISAQLAQDARSVFHAIMDAVTSIQFHDITRQQIEHVTAALDHLAAQTPGKAHPQDIAAALELETMQLASANDTFAESVTRLWHDLEGIASSVEGMAHHGRALVQECGNDSGFFLEVQHCLDAIAGAITTHRSAESATRQAACSLAPTLQAMNEAAAEIRVLDVQLLRVALNANIRAAHLGPRGATLAVLASALQDLATKARQRSEDAALALHAMGSAVTLLVGAPLEEGPDLTAPMRDTMTAWKDASEAGTLRLTGIASSATQLATGIARARDGFRAGSLFAEAVPACLAHLRRITAQATGQALRSPARDGAETLDGFARQYTMQSERDIHASVTTHEAPQALLVAAGDAEFGDNVELF